ncbi:MAG: 3-oxoadipate enol-lactonase, partial [Myxococcota bacterium]
MHSAFTRSDLVVDDGVRLAVFDTGFPAGKPDARTIVVVNGLGGNLTTWRHQLNHLVPDYRLVTWDYRGL